MDILVVDDMEVVRFTLMKILERGGHNVVGEAKDGAEAVEQYRKLMPEVVIIDLSMPKMDGIEAIKKIREFDPCAKILVCSALGQKQKVIDAFDAGADDFIVKPFNAALVLEKLEKVREKRSKYYFC